MRGTNKPGRQENLRPTEIDRDRLERLKIRCPPRGRAGSSPAPGIKERAAHTTFFGSSVLSPWRENRESGSERFGRLTDVEATPNLGAPRGLRGVRRPDRGERHHPFRDSCGWPGSLARRAVRAGGTRPRWERSVVRPAASVASEQDRSRSSRRDGQSPGPSSGQRRARRRGATVQSLVHPERRRAPASRRRPCASFPAPATSSA